MGNKIFINYRRGDDPGFAGRLFDRLEQHFSQDQIFIDVDHIAPGLDFVHVLEDQVNKCDVLLAIIGKGWIDARDEFGARRLESTADFVRIEIEAALKLRKRVIPVLVNGAEMPRADQLPETMKELAVRNAVRLTYERFRSDAQGLIKALTTALEEAEQARILEAEQQRKSTAAAAEAEAQREKQRAREIAIAGLSPEQISKAEELANWEFVKDLANPQEFRDHLARFPGGVTTRMARTKLESLVWSGLDDKSSIEVVRAFLEEFPDGVNAVAAKTMLAKLEEMQEEQRRIDQRNLREAEDWAAALMGNGSAAVRNFLGAYPKGKFAETAKTKLYELEIAEDEAKWRAAADAGTPEALREFLVQNPSSRYAREARRALGGKARPDWVLIGALGAVGAFIVFVIVNQPAPPTVVTSSTNPSSTQPWAAARNPQDYWWNKDSSSSQNTAPAPSGNVNAPSIDVNYPTYPASNIASDYWWNQESNSSPNTSPASSGNVNVSSETASPADACAVLRARLGAATSADDRRTYNVHDDPHGNVSWSLGTADVQRFKEAAAAFECQIELRRTGVAPAKAQVPAGPSSTEVTLSPNYPSYPASTKTNDYWWNQGPNQNTKSNAQVPAGASISKVKPKTEDYWWNQDARSQPNNPNYPSYSASTKTNDYWWNQDPNQNTKPKTSKKKPVHKNE